MKYLVVTGGVVSGLGKGISISSMGVLLKAHGLRCTRCGARRRGSCGGCAQPLRAAFASGAAAATSRALPPRRRCPFLAASKLTRTSTATRAR